MTWKKTWFSYFLWGLSSIFACLTFVSVSIHFLNQYNLPIYWMMAFIAVPIVCYLLIKVCKNRIQGIRLSRACQITFESLVFAGLLAGGLLIRMYSMVDVSSSDLFHMAAISDELEKIHTSHGAMNLYAMLLRSLFYFIGNSWIGAVILQIILQLICFSVLYFIVRKTTGVIAALSGFAFLMFWPESISAGVGLYPSVLYFLLCTIALYFLTESNCRIIENQEIKVYQFLTVILIGLLCGFLIYLDISGLFLLLFGLTLLGVCKTEVLNCKIKYKPLYFILFIVGILLGFVDMMILDAHFSGSGIRECFLNFEWTYSPSLGQSLYSVHNLNMNMAGWIFAGILLLSLLLGVAGFWEHKQLHPQLGWIIICLFFLVMQYNCPGAENMNRFYFFCISISFWAGSGLQALFTGNEVTEMVMISEDQVAIVEDEMPLANDAVEGNEMFRANDTVEENETAHEVQFIPNPLPLPKKHVKKTMGYGFEVEEDLMYFDIEITEEDDFDI